MDSYEAYVHHCVIENDTKLSKSNSLIEYHKNTKGKRLGVVVAYREGDTVLVGYSLCHHTEPRGFNKYVGINKAMHAAIPLQKLATPLTILSKGVRYGWQDIPNSLHSHIKHIVERAYRYFKDIPGRPVNIEGEVDIPDISQVVAAARVVIEEKQHTSEGETGYEFSEAGDDHGTTEIPKELESYIRPLEFEKK